MAVAMVSITLLASGCTTPETPAPDDTAPPAQEPQTPVQEEATDVDWKLTSSAFEDGESIPARYTCSGQDLSPTLEWTDPPEGTQELAMVVDDPDAPRGTFVHWVIYGLDPDISALPEGMPAGEELDSPVVCRQGRNDFDAMGYRGPCPPGGEEHRYFFKLYALEETINLRPGVTKAELMDEIEGKTIAKAELVGRYSR